MRVLLSGGSGRVGAFVGPALAAAGHGVTHLSRRPVAGDWRAFDLAGAPPALAGADALVHLAFHHAPGRYRGGEGDDPARFLRLNRDGSLRLFDAARRAGVGRVIFLSSRAVYGDGRRGEILREGDAAAPDSLYGAMKLEVEGAADASIRATGVYGLAPGASAHKWTGLFEDYLAGREAPSRAATELHGDDLASAVLTLLRTGSGAFNASDLMVDHHDLLTGVGARTGCGRPPPPRASGPPPGEMATDRLRTLGWTPGGAARLGAFLDACFPT